MEVLRKAIEESNNANQVTKTRPASGGLKAAPPQRPRTSDPRDRSAHHLRNQQHQQQQYPKTPRIPYPSPSDTGATPRSKSTTKRTMPVEDIGKNELASSTKLDIPPNTPDTTSCSAAELLLQEVLLDTAQFPRPFAPRVKVCAFVLDRLTSVGPMSSTFRAIKDELFPALFHAFTASNRTPHQRPPTGGGKGRPRHRPPVHYAPDASLEQYEGSTLQVTQNEALTRRVEELEVQVAAYHHRLGEAQKMVRRVLDDGRQFHLGMHFRAWKAYSASKKRFTRGQLRYHDTIKKRMRLHNAFSVWRWDAATTRSRRAIEDLHNRLQAQKTSASDATVELNTLRIRSKDLQDTVHRLEVEMIRRAGNDHEQEQILEEKDETISNLKHEAGSWRSLCVAVLNAFTPCAPALPSHLIVTAPASAKPGATDAFFVQKASTPSFGSPTRGLPLPFPPPETLQQQLHLSSSDVPEFLIKWFSGLLEFSYSGGNTGAKATDGHENFASLRRRRASAVLPIAHHTSMLVVHDYTDLRSCAALWRVCEFLKLVSIRDEFDDDMPDSMSTTMQSLEHSQQTDAEGSSPTNIPAVPQNVSRVVSAQRFLRALTNRLPSAEHVTPDDIVCGNPKPLGLLLWDILRFAAMPRAGKSSTPSAMSMNTDATRSTTLEGARVWADRIATLHEEISRITTPVHAELYTRAATVVAPVRNSSPVSSPRRLGSKANNASSPGRKSTASSGPASPSSTTTTKGAPSPEDSFTEISPAAAKYVVDALIGGGDDPKRHHAKLLKVVQTRGALFMRSFGRYASKKNALLLEGEFFPLCRDCGVVNKLVSRSDALRISRGPLGITGGFLSPVAFVSLACALATENIRTQFTSVNQLALFLDGHLALAPPADVFLPDIPILQELVFSPTVVHCIEKHRGTLQDQFINYSSTPNMAVNMAVAAGSVSFKNSSVLMKASSIDFSTLPSPQGRQPPPPGPPSPDDFATRVMSYEQCVALFRFVVPASIMTDGQCKALFTFIRRAIMKLEDDSATTTPCATPNPPDDALTPDSSLPALSPKHSVLNVKAMSPAMFHIGEKDEIADQTLVGFDAFLQCVALLCIVVAPLPWIPLGRRFDMMVDALVSGGEFGLRRKSKTLRRVGSTPRLHRTASSLSAGSGSGSAGPSTPLKKAPSRKSLKS